MSISHRNVGLPPGINYDYLARLLEVSDRRYVELKSAGAEYCLPGQMLQIRKKQTLVRHELDGNLLLDARIHLRDLFHHLYNIKNQVENNNPSEKCYQYFSVVHKETVQQLGVWEDPVEINALTGGSDD